MVTVRPNVFQAAISSANLPTKSRPYEHEIFFLPFFIFWLVIRSLFWERPAEMHGAATLLCATGGMGGIGGGGWGWRERGEDPGAGIGGIRLYE